MRLNPGQFLNKEKGDQFMLNPAKYNKISPLWGGLMALLLMSFAASPLYAASWAINDNPTSFSIRPNQVTTPTLPTAKYLGDGIDLGNQCCQTVQGFDMDGDGHRELLAVTTNNGTNNLRLYEFGDNNTTPTLVWKTTTGGTDGTSNLNNLRIIAVGDSDGDGKLEMLVGVTDTAMTGSVVKIYEFDPSATGGQLAANNPTTATATVVLPVGGIAPATACRIAGILVDDVDNNGHPDVIISTQATARSLVIYSSTGDNTYGTPVTVALTTGGQDISNVAVDLDGDGAKEFAMLGYNRSLNILNFNGTTATVEYTTGTGANNAGFNLNIGDIDNNGTPEVVYADSVGAGIKIIEGVSANTYTCDAPAGLFPNCGSGLTAATGSASILKLSDTGQGAVLMGCQNGTPDGQGGPESFWITYHTGPVGSFTAADFTASAKLLEPPQEPVWISSFSQSGSLDGDDHADIILGTRSTNSATDGYGEMYWMEADTFFVPVELSSFGTE
jgi:hypothetical protein